MKRSFLPLSCVIIVLILGACTLPQLTTPTTGGATSSSTGTSGTGTDTGSSGGSFPSQPRVMNDVLNGQALFLTGAGAQIEVSAVDPTSGKLVRCVSADSFTVIKPESTDVESPVKIVVVGKRDDGHPGVWEITRDNKIRLTHNEDNSDDGNLTPYDIQAPERMYHRFGWDYHPIAVSDDGKMIVGYAENTRGFRYGNVEIPAGTTVGVYWKVWSVHDGEFSIVSRPYVIGTWQKPHTHFLSAFRFVRHRFHFLSYLKAFFLGRLESYLVMTTGVRYDSATGSYVVSGTDQDGNSATATITLTHHEDEIVIEPVSSPPPPPDGYTEIVVDTYNPTGPAPGFNFDVVSLFSADGVASALDPWTDPEAGALAVDGLSASGGSNPNTSEQPYFAYIDYKVSPGFPSGTVLYVRINGYTKTTEGPYGIRILTAPSSTYTYATSENLLDSPYEPDSAANPVQVSIGQELNRYLTAGDVDWVSVTLE